MSDVRGSLKRPLVRVVVAAVALALMVWGVVAITSSPDTYRVNANFISAPGVYSGNAVKVLGVRVGKVESVTPNASGVKVVMRVESSTKLPSDVKAYLMAPNVVNDRFIELDPGYVGGAVLEAEATLPTERTVIPQSVDQIVASLDRLATDLGPEGANADGSASKLISAVAETLGGQGAGLNSTIKNMGGLFAALSQDSDELTSGLTDLGDLTEAASGVSGQYQRFASDLAEVSTTLADDNVAIGGAIKNLGSMLAELNTFVHNNKAQLSDTLSSLSKVAGAVGDQQKSLAQALRISPLAAQNVDRTITKDGVKVRFNPLRDQVLHKQVCGNGVLRMLVLSLAPEQDDNLVMDLACGTNELMSGLRPGSGAPSGVDFTRKALLKLGGR